MTVWTVVGMILALSAIVGVSVYSGRKVKNADEFDKGGRSAGALMVSGAVMGTLVGGSSTVGTAQLAYTYGLSAWWFTLGAGIACVILIFFVAPVRRTGRATLVGIIADKYGEKTGVAASLLSSVGTFINILSQLISATAIISIVFPKTPRSAEFFIAAAFMIIYVIFGGILGAGMVGTVKLLLLSATAIFGGVLALPLSGGFGALYSTLPHSQYFNLFARGIGTDGGAALSLIFGVLSTQSYAQAIMSGRSDSAARGGALISAAVMPVIGAGGILVGLYMRVSRPELASAKTAFPEFVLSKMPPLAAGIALATLFITVLGTGAGLSLGISTMIRNDLIKKKTRKFDDPKKGLLLSRGIIIVVLAAAAAVCVCPVGDTILNFAFMSMGLRGAVVFAPLCCALWLGDRVKPGFILAAIIAGPLFVLVFGLIKVLPFDPLFIGMAISFILCAAGTVGNGKKI
ncbi:MAG: sodium:solute symporter family protein [Clostridia bacterium]|nr:sodium:solute symporter family protein [Clostridia bacterium]